MNGKLCVSEALIILTKIQPMSGFVYGFQWRDMTRKILIFVSFIGLFPRILLDAQGACVEKKHL